jgi:hypothetical protein
MTQTIELAFVVFGLGLLFWAITAADAGPGRRTTAAAIGIVALIAAIVAALMQPHDDWKDRT